MTEEEEALKFEEWLEDECFEFWPTESKWYNKWNYELDIPLYYYTDKEVYNFFFP